MIPVNKIPEVDLQQLKSNRDHEEVAATVDSEEAVEEKKILAIIKKMCGASFCMCKKDP